MVQNPPLFLENVILGFADDPHTAAYSVGGLEHLATPSAKAKLAKLSGPGNPEYIRQMAIEALAELGDPAYCSAMLDVVRESSEYSRFIALRAAGYLCGEKVLPLATSQLGSGDHSPRFEAAYALGNSHTRKAIPPLISLLLDRMRTYAVRLAIPLLPSPIATRKTMEGQRKVFFVTGTTGGDQAENRANLRPR